MSNSIENYLKINKDALDAHQHTLIRLLSQYTNFKSSSFFSKFSKYLSATKEHTISGIYIYGGVGRGKSLIAKAYFDAANLPAEQKLYMHYQEFFRMIHTYIHQMDKQSKSQAGDVITRLVQNLPYRLICIDEFEVKDITDAMILYRLFMSLIKLGIFIVLTTNFAPRELYKGGLHRDRFLPFIKLIEERFNLFHLDSTQDYRRLKLAAENERIVSGANKALLLQQVINNLVPTENITPRIIEVFGRKLALKRTWHNIALSNFEELCANPLSYNDYLEICSNFDIIVIDHVPTLDDTKLNELIRFIHLIDAIYMKHLLLFLYMDVPVDELYTGSLRKSEFERTKSRLKEMNSAEYGARY